MEPVKAARNIQQLFRLIAEGNKVDDLVPEVKEIPALPLDRWVELLTSPLAGSNRVFIDRPITHSELRSMIDQPSFPFVFFTGTPDSARPLFHAYPHSGSRITEFLSTSPGESIVIASIPVDEEVAASSVEGPVIPEGVSTLQKLLAVLKPERKEIFYILSYAVFVGLIGLSLPLGIQSLIGFISSGQMVTSAVILVAFILAGILLSGIMTIFQLELVERLQQKLFARTAFSFAYRVPRLKLESVLKYYPPELMNRFFDTLTLQKGVPVLLIDLSAAVLQVVFGIILLSFYHPLFILLGSVLAMLLIAVIRFTGRSALKTALEESDYKYQVANWLEELARSLSTFKLSGNSTLALEKTDEYVGSYIRARDRHFRVLRIQYYSFIVFKTVITAFLLILGMTLIVGREINLGQFVAAEIVIILIMNSIEKIILKIDDVYDVMAGVEKITKVTGLPVEDPGEVHLDVQAGKGLSMEVRGLGFRYPDRSLPTIRTLSFSVRSGERVCFAGGNGAGKSTLIQLLLGIYSPTEGRISYDGISLNVVHKPSLMNHIGNYVTQDTLFDGTVFENIVLGRRHITMADVRWAVEAAGVREFVENLAGGFQERLVGGGVRLPESIIHKLILARNIAERPSLLIIDDFLLGVEASEKKRILEFLLDRSHSWTVLLVSTDPMVLSAVDRILWLENGTLHAEGSYDELIKLHGFVPREQN